MACRIAVLLISFAGALALVMPSPLMSAPREAVAKAVSVQFTVSVKTSPDALYETRKSFVKKPWSRAWPKVSAAPDHPASGLVPYGDAYMEVMEGGSNRKFSLREDGVLLEPDTGSVITMPDAIRKQWVEQAESLRRIHYGELISWDDAKTGVPLKSKVTVVDLETGLTFRAQRRAGSLHADVQPLTKQDTATMKHIYDGSWSWKRRAILVLYGGRKLAGSMHGMPHGGDGIPDNDFSGHFCIHFLGSSTHKTGSEDFAHQLMVHKAAGRLDSLLAQSPPARLAETFLESLKQQDEALLRAVLRGADPDTLSKYCKLLQSVESVRYELPASADPKDALTAEYRVKAHVDGRGGGVRVQTFRFLFARETPDSAWQLTEVDLELAGNRAKRPPER